MPFEQSPRFNIEIPSSSLNVYNDVRLDEPVLVGITVANFAFLYGDNARICAFLGVPLTFRWNAVTNATKYLLQVCRNSNFIGPTLRTIPITAPTTTAIYYAGQNLAVELQYFWRVMAFNITGGASPKSDVWNFTLSCDGYDYSSNQPNPSPSSSSSSSSSCKCENGFKKEKIIVPDSVNIQCQNGNVVLNFTTKEICVKDCL